MKSKTVFIACQDNNMTKSLSDYFHSLGYRVEIAQCISDIIRKIQNRKAHVILLDEEIEGVKACDLVSIVKKIHPKMLVIAISSEESVGIAKRLRGAGIFYQAMKPIDLKEIRSVVECAFEKYTREEAKEGFFSFLIPKMVTA